MFQQATRTRNIQTLYYYSQVDEPKPKKITNNNKAKYNNMKQLKQLLNNNLEETLNTNSHSCDKFNDACTYLNAEDNIVIVENTFYNIFVYNEYANDTYNTNKRAHFELILTEFGFKLSTYDHTTKIKITKTERISTNDIYSEMFDDYIESSSEDRQKDEFKQIHDQVLYLKLENQEDDILEEFKDIIIDTFKITEHDNLISLLKSDRHIEDRLNEQYKICYDVKLYNNITNKIKLLRQLERSFGLKPLEVDFRGDANINIDEKTYILIKTLFRTTKANPKTLDEFKKLYVSIIKNITGGSDMIKTTRSTAASQNSSKRKYTYNYKLDSEVIQMHLRLNKFKNKKCIKFDDHIKVLFDIKDET